MTAAVRGLLREDAGCRTGLSEACTRLKISVCSYLSYGFLEASELKTIPLRDAC